MIKSIFTVITVAIYFWVQFAYTQKLYSNGKIYYASIVGVINFLASFYFLRNEPFALQVLAAPFLLIYSILLSGVKKWYERLNNFLINKRIITEKFRGKDFTYIQTSQFSTWWDEKRATAPSSLDWIITVILLLLPFPLARLLYEIIHSL